MDKATKKELSSFLLLYPWPQSPLGLIPTPRGRRSSNQEFIGSLYLLERKTAHSKDVYLLTNPQ